MTEVRRDRSKYILYLHTCIRVNGEIMIKVAMLVTENKTQYVCNLKCLTLHLLWGFIIEMFTVAYVHKTEQQSHKAWASHQVY